MNGKRIFIWTLFILLGFGFLNAAQKSLSFLKHSSKFSKEVKLFLMQNPDNDYNVQYEELLNLKTTILKETKIVYVVEEPKFDRYYFAYPLIPILVLPFKEGSELADDEFVLIRRSSTLKDELNLTFIQATSTINVYRRRP
jgi:hypothetical protein